MSGLKSDISGSAGERAAALDTFGPLFPEDQTRLLDAFKMNQLFKLTRRAGALAGDDTLLIGDARFQAPDRRSETALRPAGVAARQGTLRTSVVGKCLLPVA